MISEKVADLVEDIKGLPEKLPLSGVDEVCREKLKTEEARSYLQKLIRGSKPESALRESFFAGKSLMGEIFGDLIPETKLSTGFADYLVEDRFSRVVLLELKSLYVVDRNELRKEKLLWKNHTIQVFRYLSEKYRYVILTDLDEWHFFSNKQCLTEGETKPFLSLHFDVFYEEMRKEANLWDYLQFKENKIDKSKLDEQFLNSLRIWVNQLSDLRFNAPDNDKTNIIIHLINKFIFIQTIEDFRVIGKINWLYNEWREKEEKWIPRGKNIVVQKFLSEIDEFFYTYYDTELFKTGVLEWTDTSEENMGKLYEKLKFVLGLNEYQQTFLGESSGITQYDFVSIDEDILGKAYEEFLADVRKEEGIYYTPKQVTQYIVGNTVGVRYDDLLNEIGKKLDDMDFEACEYLIGKFVSLKVLDPACGSGSFLIKALRLVWMKYQELIHLLSEHKNRYDIYDIGPCRSDENEKNYRNILYLRRLLDFKDKRDLVSKVVLRHIYGIDKDRNALEVAKINIWLEAIKLAPEKFRYEELSNLEHILPDLEMNLGNGDSLIGLPEKETVELLKTGSKNELRRLFELRELYLKNPTVEDIIDEINSLKRNLHQKLDDMFFKYFEKNNLPRVVAGGTKPFHWSLDFWFTFLNEDLQEKPDEQKAFDIIIGNPPYHIVFDKNLKAFLETRYPTFRRNNDVFVAFVQRSIELLKLHGLFSFIIPNTFSTGPYYDEMKKYILESTKILKIADFGTKQVFRSSSIEDPNVFNAIIVLEKENNREERDLCVVQLIDFTEEDHLEERNHRKSARVQKDLWDMHWKPVDPLVERLLRITPKLGEICYVKDVGLNYWTKGRGKKRGGSIGSRVIYSGERKNDDDIPFLKGGDIERYWYSFGNHWLKHDYESYLDPEVDVFRFSPEFLERGEKIIYRQTADRIIAALDQNRYYLDKTAHLAVLKHDYEKDFCLKYLLAVLNSKLATYFYRDRAKEEGRTFAQVKIFVMEKIPIMQIPREYSLTIVRLVDNMISLVRAQHEFRRLWQKHIEVCKDKQDISGHVIGRKTFGQILLRDRGEIQNERVRQAFTTAVSFYPNKEVETSEKEFDKFRITRIHQNGLRIIGLSGSIEEVVFEFVARNENLRDLFYIEISESLNSKKTIKTLKEIFEKIEVSTVQPNIGENSENLIQDVRKQFKQWLEKESQGTVETDIIRIEERILDVDNQIDAYIFRISGLSRDETEGVLDSMAVSETIKLEILEKFDNLIKIPSFFNAE